MIIKNINKTIKEVSNVEPAYVTSLKDGIAIVRGLTTPKFQGVVKINSTNKGYILKFNEKEAVVGILKGTEIKAGDFVEMTDEILSIDYSKEMLGHVVECFGNIVSSDFSVTNTKKVPIEKEVVSLIERKNICEPLKTGILSVDTCIPIGKGQRELIIGDRETGKTQIAIDTMVNQKDTGVINIYVAIEQKAAKVKLVQEQLINSGLMKNSIIFIASSDDLIMNKYLIPFTAVTVAEELMLEGNDVVICYDDLSKHAEIYRSISLLMDNPPGREAYPGDIFYLHARLLERAACIENGSITALPIVETQEGDISSFIATNIIGITDGQLFTSSKLFQKGFKPSIDLGYSVSRVGSSAQTAEMKKASNKILSDYIKFVNIQKNSIVGMDLIGSMKDDFENGEILEALFIQEELSPLSENQQIFLLELYKTGQLQGIDITKFKHEFSKLEISVPYSEMINNGKSDIIDELLGVCK